MKVIGNLIEKIVLIFSAILIGMSVYTIFTTESNNDTYFFNLKPVVVATNQMSPDLNKNDILIVRKTDNLNIGDIACYVQQEKITTHKIKDIKPNGDVITSSKIGLDPYKKKISEIDGKVIFKTSAFNKTISDIRDDYIMGSIKAVLKIIIFVFGIKLIILLIKNRREIVEYLMNLYKKIEKKYRKEEEE